MLEYCDHLVINPVLGPKKSGDVRVDCLSEVFAHLIRTKYEEKISFQPNLRKYVLRRTTRSNPPYNYARQDRISAIHNWTGSCRCKRCLFTRMELQLLVKQLNGRLSINVIAHDGAAFCPTCNEIIIVGDL